MRLRFYYDVVCPYAWLASRRVSALAARTGAEVEWFPVLLGGIFRSIGAPDRPAESWSMSRAVRIAEDLEREVRREGEALSFPPGHPRRTVNAMRLLCAAPDAVRPALSEALYRAYWLEHRDVNDPATLNEIAARFGLPAELFASEDAKARLFANTEVAIRAGLFGVPAFQVGGEGRIWWGQDRMHLVEAALGGPAQHVRFTGPPSTAEIELFHDFASPFAYLGVSQALALARDRGVRLRLRPVLLGALFREIGTPDVPLFEMTEPKRRYYAQDLEDWAAWWGLPFHFPSHFPVRTVLPLRVSLLDERSVLPLYRALWAEDRDIADPAVVRAVLDEAGLDGGALVAGAEDPAVKASLRQNNADAEALGVCGVPTFRVGEALYWGQDRLYRVNEAV